MPRTPPRPSTARRFLVATFLVPALLRAQGPLPDPKTIMEKHNAAIGGRPALDKHTSIHMKATLVVAGRDGMRGTMEIFRGRPDKYLRKMLIDQMGETREGFDGKVAWLVDPAGGAQVLDAVMAAGVKKDADFASNYQDISAYTKSETLEVADFDDRKCYKVKLVKDGKEGIEYFDVETGLLAGVVSMAPGPQGPAEMVRFFLDYSDVAGVKFPKRIEQRGGAGAATITFTSIVFDTVDPAVFALPPAVRALVKP